MACKKCNQGGSTSCKCNKKPPAIPANCCVEPVSTDCVIYNQAPNRSSIKCFLGLDNGVTLTKVLERIDDLLCIKPSDCAKAKFGLGCDTSATIVLHKLLDYVCDLGDTKVKATPSDKSAGTLYEKISVGECLVKSILQDSDGNQTVNIAIDYDCLKLKFPCCGPGGGVAISISGANSICGNNTAILTASTNCTGTITWSNGLTGLSIQASAGTYYATCGGVQSNAITVTNTGSCNCTVSTWNFTGAARCNANNSEVEQISNCGTYRWIAGGNACTQANCVPVKFQNNTNQVQAFSYLCQGQVITTSIPAFGCIVVNAVIGEWSIPNPGSITPTPGGTCGSFNKVRTQTFTRNNCPVNCTPGTFLYTQTYTSYISQADADNLAANDSSFAVNGQNAANSNGTCTNCGGCTLGPWTNTGQTRCQSNVSQIEQRRQLADCTYEYQWINGGNACTNCTVFNNTQMTGTANANFSRNNCANGCTTTPVNYSQTAIVGVGTVCGSDLAAANANAQNQANTNAQNLVNSGGQAFANANGVCSNCPVSTPTVGGSSVTQQPTCSNSGNGVASFSGIVNGDRYRYCSGSVFNCTNSCTSPDGLIGGGAFNITLPTLGNSTAQSYTIRIYNGTDCNAYVDTVVTFSAWTCDNSVNLVPCAGGANVQYQYDQTFVQNYLGSVVSIDNVCYTVGNVSALPYTLPLSNNVELQTIQMGQCLSNRCQGIRSIRFVRCSDLQVFFYEDFNNLVSFINNVIFFGGACYTVGNLSTNNPTLSTISGTPVVETGCTTTNCIACQPIQTLNIN